MARSLHIVLLAICFAGLNVMAKKDCGVCDLESCESPTRCLGGMVKDFCGCCFVCGRIEGEKCDNDSIPELPYKHKYGYCGQHLECTLRDDLLPDELPEALCVCKHKEVLCASDGKTYSNMCLMMEQSYRTREKLKVVTRGPCKSKPWVVTGPTDQQVPKGNNAALSCEVMGYPIPTIEWQLSRPDGTIVELPSDDQHIAVQARGGPEKFEVTGWLQILDFQIEDLGEYHCVARNAEGEARATANLYLQGSSEENEDENDVDKE